VKTIRARCQYELINDLLTVMNKEDHLTLKQIAEYAYMSYATARRPFRAMATANLALLTGLTPIDSAVITQKGLQYLATFRELQHLRRSGFKP